MGTIGMQSTDREPKTPVGSMSESQLRPFFTQVILENTKLDEGGASTNQKKSRVRFTLEEDKHLIQTWLNISRDATVGVDQKADSFWSRIKDNYNENRRSRIRERGMIQLKSRWHKLNDIVQKFSWCYKQAARRKKSGSLDSDILADAHVIFNQDEGKHFNHEYAWRLLKDEPKWITESFESSKKRRIFASKAYSSSSNPSTPTSCEYDPASPTLVQPIGKEAANRNVEAAKRNLEAKPDETSSSNVVGILQEAVKFKMTVMAEFTRVKDEENNVEKEKVKLEKEKLKFNEMQILLTDTSKLTERQRRDHEIICNVIREKYGMI